VVIALDGAAKRYARPNHPGTRIAAAHAAYAPIRAAEGNPPSGRVLE